MDKETHDVTSLIEFFEISRDAFLTVDENLVITYANPAMKNYSNFQKDKMIGKRLQDVFQECSISYDGDIFCKALNDRLPHDWKNFSEFRDCWIDVCTYPINNNQLAIIVRTRNIAVTEKIKETLYRSEERYKAFINTCFDSVYIMSPDWSHMYMLDGKGILADTLESDSSWGEKYIHSDDWPYVFEAINDAIVNKTIFDLEHRVFKKDGSLAWTHSRAVPIKDDDGLIVEWLGTAKDITLRKQFELRLIEKEREYLEILDGSSLGSLIVDMEKKEIYISETWKKRLGLEKLKPKEVFEQHLSVIHEDEVGQVMKNLINTFFKKKTKFKAEYRIKTVDSDYIWILDQAKIIYNKEGKPVKGYGTNIDINDRKLAEEALKKGKEMLITIMENSRDGINMFDLKAKKYVYMNQSQVSMASYSESELKNIPKEEAYMLIHPDDRHIAVKQQENIASGCDKYYDSEYRWKVKSGEYRWFSDRRTLLRDEFGDPEYLIGISRDITEQKEYEEKLAFQAKILSNVSDATIVIDENERITYCNHAFENLFGWQEQELEGQLFFELAKHYVHEDSIWPSDERQGSCIAGKANKIDGIRCKAKDGTQLIVDTNMTVVKGSAGEYKGLILSIRDVSERYEYEQKLKRSEEKYRNLFNSIDEGLAIVEVIFG